jgi:actin-related protein 6
VQETYDQLVFEEYEFTSYLRCPCVFDSLYSASVPPKSEDSAAPLLQYGDLFEQGSLPAPECFLIVDSGFSFTHIVPVMRGVMVLAGIHRYDGSSYFYLMILTNCDRIDVGGKLLTNHLKEVVSFRHWDLMEHTYVMNEVKEACCYVSNTFSEDLEACQCVAELSSLGVTKGYAGE